ncbi:hypothetical protein J0871_16720 [Salegentibacter sp. BDJ18]|uniref:hypothetical protein n=1 Tax=Salegentibacter sp. BDJ18 TaxID=2816376 RepID=UPI001AAF0572|nr:hypothetical protein [Salegentibacter sp. BDJ18]MBO2546062.1 hypothetical protein [Salegentibacter sp. BDJ18]
MANKLGITQGKEWAIKAVECEIGIAKKIEVEDVKVAMVATDIGVTPDEEVEANAVLVADAFEIANKCQKLPSELLKERDALLEKLKDMTKYIRRELTLIHEAPEKEIKLILDGSEELIQSVEE